MKKIILISIIYSSLIISVHGQSGNLLSGTDAGYSIGNYDDYNTAYGYKASYGDIIDYTVSFGAFAAYGKTGYGTISIGYKSIFNHGISNNYTTAVGVSAGYDNNGDENIFIGNYTGECTDGTASYNTGIEHTTQTSFELSGYDVSLTLSVDDMFNTLTTGAYNTALGSLNSSDLTTGSNNTTIGTGSGVELNDGEDNTFIGTGSGGLSGRTGTANSNTFIGYGTGCNNYTGDGNTLIGHGANMRTTGLDIQRGIGVGVLAEIGKDDAIAFGYEAYNNGEYGIAVGYQAYVDEEGGIGIGYQSNISTDTYGLGIGSSIDIDGAYAIGIGANVDIDNTNAIAIGHNAIANGDYSIAYGANSSVTGDNSVALGNGVAVSTDNTITIGNASITSIRGTVNWTTLSDGRYKSDVKENIVGLDFINQLRPVSYELTADGKRLTDASLDGNKTVSRQPLTVNRWSGFIAQEVETAAENIGYDFSGVKKPQNEDDIYGLRYTEFVVPLTKAVQELDEQHQFNEAIIQKNKTKLAHYENAIAQLKAKVEALKNQKEATANNHSQQPISTASQPE